jgi:hypothetical protein
MHPSSNSLVAPTANQQGANLPLIRSSPPRTPVNVSNVRNARYVSKNLHDGTYNGNIGGSSLYSFVTGLRQIWTKI